MRCGVMAIERVPTCRLVVIERFSLMWVMVIERFSPNRGMDRVWSVFLHNVNVTF